MRLCEFTKPGDYAPIARRPTTLPASLNEIWKDALCEIPKKGGGGGDGAHQRETMITQ